MIINIFYKTEEWVKYKEELKQKHDERDYQKMINNVSNKGLFIFKIFIFINCEQKQTNLPYFQKENQLKILKKVLVLE